MKTMNNKSIEIQCYMHRMCNLNCDFCFQNDESGVRENDKASLDYIKQLPDDIVSTVVPVMKRDNLKMVHMVLSGGEIFLDNISDEIFDVYREFLYELEIKLRKEIHDVEFDLKCLTNGVYTKHERIEEFLKEFNARIILSYDPIDRFTNDKQKEIWYNTFKYFNNTNIRLTVSAVLTKKNLYAYMNGDELFNRIGNGIYIETLEYTPGSNYQEYLPNDEDLFKFYKWALDNSHFGLSHVKNILEHSPECDFRPTYSFGEYLKKQYGKLYIVECNELYPFSKKPYFGKYADKIDDPNDCLRCKQPAAMEKRGCLACERYSQCPKLCWSQILFDKYELSTCPIKHVYDYIDENPIIIDKYNNWRNQYGY